MADDDTNIFLPQNKNNGAGIAEKPSVLLVSLLACISLMGGIFAYSASQLNQNKEYINIAGEQRVLALQIVKHASEASRSKVDAFPMLLNASYAFEANLGILTKGNPDNDLPASTGEVMPRLLAINKRWPEVSKNIDTVLREEGIIRMLREFVIAINDVMPELQTLHEDLSQIMLKNNSRASEVFIATRQAMILQRIATNINRIIQADTDNTALAATLKKDIEEFSAKQNAMLRGSGSKGVERITIKDAHDKLETIQPLFDTVEELVTRVLEKSPQLFLAQNAANELFPQIEALLKDTTDLVRLYVASGNKIKILNYAGYTFGIASLVLLLALGSAMMKSTRGRLKKEAAANTRNQTAILRLLDEIGPLADGDLTAKATVTEEITGSIADAINYTIDALRDLVVSVNHMSGEVANSAEETLANALHSARASEQQATQIGAVTSAIDQMATEVSVVSASAQKSAAVAKNSVETAEQGARAVANTIGGMHSIQNAIRDTSTRIKRLGESSQEIGDILELIDDIADQTNILALNAAIKSSTANQGTGEFGNLADEMQQLADRVAQSTQRIETLIHAIQMDTAKAVVSMEQSTHNVLEGTRLASQAGEGLVRIQTVSKTLAELIQSISRAANTLNMKTDEVITSMNRIKSITSQNLAGAKQTASLTEKLSELASEQKQTIRGFRLPDEPRSK